RTLPASAPGRSARPEKAGTAAPDPQTATPPGPATGILPEHLRGAALDAFFRRPPHLAQSSPGAVALSEQRVEHHRAQAPARHAADRVDVARETRLLLLDRGEQRRSPVRRADPAAFRCDDHDRISPPRVALAL